MPSFLLSNDVTAVKLSLHEWLVTREPAPPDALLARMLREIEKLRIMQAEAAPRLLADAGASILESLDDEGCTGRASALDLLAADALFTYAFEAAAESQSEVEAASGYVLEKVTQK